MSSTLIFIKLVTYRLKYNFQDNGHSFTLTLPNTKPNRFRISSFKSRDKFNLPIYQTCKHLGQNLVFATRVISILSFYQIYNHIGSNIMFHKGHRGTSSNFPFIKLLSIYAKISFSHQESFQDFHFTEFKRK